MRQYGASKHGNLAKRVILVRLLPAYEVMPYSYRRESLICPSKSAGSCPCAMREACKYVDEKRAVKVLHFCMQSR